MKSKVIEDVIFDGLLLFMVEVKKNPLGLRRRNGRSCQGRKGMNNTDAFHQAVSQAYDTWQGINWDDVRAKEILKFDEKIVEGESI